MFGRVECPAQLPRRDRIDLRFAREEPTLGSRFTPVVPQKVSQVRRQHHLAVLLTLALIDMDQHPVAVDIADLEIADLRCAQPGTVGNTERRTILQTRTRGRSKKLRNIFDAQHRWQLPRLSAELHILLHIFASTSLPKQEPERHDPRIVCRRRDLSIGHVQLIGAQIIRRGRIRRPLQKPGKILDRPDMGLLRFIAHPMDAHVFEHPLTQRRCLLICHGNSPVR